MAKREKPVKRAQIKTLADAQSRIEALEEHVGLKPKVEKTEPPAEDDGGDNGFAGQN